MQEFCRKECQWREWVVRMGLQWRNCCSNNKQYPFCCCQSWSLDRVECCCSTQKQGSVVGCRFHEQIYAQNKISPLSAKQHLGMCMFCVTPAASLCQIWIHLLRLYWTKTAPKQSHTYVTQNFWCVKCLNAIRVRQGKDTTWLQLKQKYVE